MLGPQRNYLLVALAMLGVVIGWIMARRRDVLLWSLALGILSLPLGIRISPFRPDHTVIVLFLPITLLASDFLFTAGNLVKSAGFARIADMSLWACVASLLAWGWVETHSIVNPTTILATSADVQAMEWISKNTPVEARFFINVTQWQYGTYRGVDGGWWIHILTGRWVFLPPVIYATGEREYILSVNALAEQASQIQACTPEFRRLIQKVGFTHIYLVEGRGALQPEALQDCAFVELIYSDDAVFIYKVVESFLLR